MILPGTWRGADGTWSRHFRGNNSYTGGTSETSWTSVGAVPEPSMAILAAAGLALLVSKHRRDPTSTGPWEGV